MVNIKQAIVENTTLLLSYAGDFEIDVEDLFADEIVHFDDPEDPDTECEVHYLIGWVTCAAMALDTSPVELVAVYAEAEGGDLE